MSQTDLAWSEEWSLPDAESEEETHGTSSEMAIEHSQCNNESEKEYDDIESGSDEDTNSSEVIARLSKAFNSSQLYSTSRINHF